MSEPMSHGTYVALAYGAAGIVIAGLILRAYLARRLAQRTLGRLETRERGPT